MQPAAPPLIQVIQIVAFTSLMAGSLVAWARISIKLATGQSVLPAEPRRPAPWNLGHVAAIAAIYFLLQAGGAFIVLKVFPSTSHAEVVAATGDLPAEVATKELPEQKHAETQEAKQDEKRSTEPSKAEDEQIEKISPAKMAAGILTHITASLLSLAIAVPLLRWTAHCTWSDLGIVPGKILNDIKLGIIGFAAAAVPIYGLQFGLSHWSTKRHPIIDWLTKTPDTSFIMLAGISTMLVAPLAEEFFFRLVFQGWLESIASYLWPKVGDLQSSESHHDNPVRLDAAVASNNPYLAPQQTDGLIAEASVGELVPAAGVAGWGPIACSALIFALMHFDHGPAPIPLFFLALLLGYLYQQTHRILPSIIVHCCLNSCSMLILWTSLWKA